MTFSLQRVVGRRAASRETQAARSALRAAVERLEDRRLLTVSLLSAVSTPLSTTPAGDPAAPVVADFDGDDKLDVLIAFPSPSAVDAGYLQFGKGDGAGTFAFSAAVQAGIFTGRPVVGDFNGDDILDIAVTNAFGGEVKVLRGAGDGTFAAATAFDAGVSPEPLAAGDFNDDGLTDLVTGNRSDNTISVYLGNSSTTLSAQTVINTATDPATVAVGDFNQDGEVDILVGASGGSGAFSGVLQVFAGNGDGTFNNSPIATTGPRGVTAVAELDGDNGLDVVVGVSDNDRADALVNNGNGTFTLTPGSTGAAATKAAVAIDMDEDSIVDLVTAVAGQIDVLPGLGNGTFGRAVSFDSAGGSGPAVADVNGDGRADVLTITATAGQTANRSVNVSLGRRIGPDLSVAFAKPVAPSALTGQRGEVTVRITNNGNAKLSRQTPIQLYASTDTTVADGDALLIQSLPRLNLNVGKSKNVKLKFDYPGGAGSYNLIAQVDPQGTTGDLNLFDNAAISATPVVVGEAFVDYSAVLPAVPTTPISENTPVKLTLELTNLGNTTGKGQVNFAVVASTDTTADTSTDVLLRSKLQNIQLKAGQTKNVKLNFKMSAVTPGPYYLLAVVEQASFVDSDLSNNTAVGPTQVTVQ